MSDQFQLLPCFIEMSVVNANSVDPDQMPHSAVADLGLHCLPSPIYGMLATNWLRFIPGHVSMVDFYGNLHGIYRHLQF